MDEIILKKCGVCKEKEAGDFCEECDQSFCMNCAEYHNNMKLLKNHRLVRLGDGEHKNHSELNLFCATTDEFFETTMINSHEKYIFQTKELEIEKRLAKWKEEVKNITDCRSEYMKAMVMDEEKWSDKKNEILEIKTDLNNNYQEFIEFLQYKQKIGCNKIEAEIDKIEEKLIHYKEQINKNKIMENKTPITKKIKLIKKDSEEIKSETLPPLHSPLNLEPHHLLFKPSPMDDLCDILPSTKSNEIEIIKTAKGGRKLLLDGYAFVVSKQGKEDVTYWSCEKRFKCKGTLVTKSKQVTKMTHHTHPPDHDRNMCFKAVAKMTLEALVSSDSTATIVKKNLSLLPLTAVTSLPLKESLARKINRRRNSLYVRT